MSDKHPYDWAVAGPPIGVWGSAVGTFAIVMSDTLTIREDGAGVLESQSVLNGAESISLAWKHSSPGVMQIALLYDGILPSDISEDMWEPINYIADWQASDVSDREPVLKNKHHEDFWTLTNAIQLIARD